MAQHAPLPDEAMIAREEAPSPVAKVFSRARAKKQLPLQVRRAVDELFDDADRHGPRPVVLVRRIVPAAIAVALALALTVLPAWRSVVIGALSVHGADVLLVAPMLVAMVALAAALAPLARINALPLLILGGASLGCSAWLVTHGQIVWATPVALVGGTLVGVAAARMVRRAVWALPLLLAAGLSDAHSVAFGVTEQLLEGTTAASTARLAATTSIHPAAVERIDLLVLHVPVASGVWMLGIVDVVAIGMLLGLAHLNWRPMLASSVALGLALVGAVASGTTVPVLPLLGLAWLLANTSLVWRATRFSLRRLTYLGG